MGVHKKQIPMEIIKKYGYKSEKDLLESMHKNKSAWAISLELDLSYHFILKRFKYHGIEANGHKTQKLDIFSRISKKRLDDKINGDSSKLSEKQILEKLYEIMTIEKIADFLEFAKSTIIKRFKDNKINARSVGDKRFTNSMSHKFRSIPDEKLAEMTRKDIADFLGCSKQHARYLVRSHDKQVKMEGRSWIERDGKRIFPNVEQKKRPSKKKAIKKPKKQGKKQVIDKHIETEKTEKPEKMTLDDFFQVMYEAIDEGI